MNSSSEQDENIFLRHLLPVGVGLIVLLLAVGLFAELRAIETDELRRTLSDRADRIQQVAEFEFNERLLAIERLAHRTALKPGQLPSQWRQRESVYTEDFSGLSQLYWIKFVGSEPVIHASVTAEGNQDSMPWELLSVLNSGQPGDTRAVSQRSEPDLIWLVEPVPNGTDGDLISATLSISGFFESLPHWTRLGHRLSVENGGGERLFSDFDNSASEASDFRVSRELDLQGVGLTVTVVPTGQQVSSVRSFLPVTVLLMGLVLAVLVGVLVSLWRHAKSREEHTKSLNRQLEQEVTSREKAERDLERSNRQLKEFAYIASHDLQEPLRTVKSFADLLEQRYRDELPDEAREFLDFITDGATRMKALINDILQLSRVQRSELELERFPAEEVVRHAMKSLHTAIEENKADIEIGELPEVRADRGQLSLMFQNLLSNALKFHQPGESPVVRVEGKRLDNSCEFVVLDKGIGIDEDYQDKIFQAFQRLHDSSKFEGTGIGLAICRQIAERHGGRIRVESEPGEGSEFRFTLGQESDSDRG